MARVSITMELLYRNIRNFWSLRVRVVDRLGRR